jgi:hypothetical protein
MAHVRLTSHLFQFFPDLEGKELTVQASTVAEVVLGMDRLAPGIGFYICDELGRLRQHVNIFVDQEMITDRWKLSDSLDPESEVFIVQALSGG